MKEVIFDGRRWQIDGLGGVIEVRPYTVARVDRAPETYTVEDVQEMILRARSKPDCQYEGPYRRVNDMVDEVVVRAMEMSPADIEQLRERLLSTLDGYADALTDRTRHHRLTAENERLKSVIRAVKRGGHADYQADCAVCQEIRKLEQEP